MLNTVGVVDAAIARETEDGRLVLVDGHLRREEISGSVPVLIVDLTENEAGQVLATLDPIAGMAQTDVDALAQLVADVEPPINWDTIFPDVDPAAATRARRDPNDVLDPDERTDVEPGAIYQLGRHRVMCGDATAAGDVALLIDDESPRLCVTDPPYGVNYDPAWRRRTGMGSARGRPIAGDDSYSLLAGALDAHGGCDVLYVWAGTTNTVWVWWGDLQEAGYVNRSLIIWRKPQLVVSRGHYHHQHEGCIYSVREGADPAIAEPEGPWHELHEAALYAVREGAAADWIGDRKQSNVWDINPVIRGRAFSAEDAPQDHGTQKPVECMERPLRNHSGDVYDPFCGSGTTVIAAERLARRCFAMDLDPIYADMTIRRWELYSGEKAVRLR